MHYYKRNIGDYYKKAGRLTMLQHGAYTQLIDACYDREQFPTLDDAIEWTWASTEEEIAAVNFVLKRFFTLEDGVYSQLRIKEEIEKYKKNGEINRKIALEREAKKRAKKTKGEENSTNRDTDSTNRDKSVNEPSTVEHERAPNQEPRTKNQEPLVKKNMPANTDSVRDIFDYWISVMGKRANTALSPKRKTKIQQRLKDGYSSEEIKQAIFNCSNTPHNMGQNDRNQRFDDIELICRSAENLERFRDNPGVSNGSNQQRINQGRNGEKLNAIDANNQQLLEQYGQASSHGEWEINPPTDPGMDSHQVSRGLYSQMEVHGVTIDMDSRDLNHDGGSDTQGSI